MLWLCTRFPNLALDAYGAWHRQRPSAVVNRHRVLHANPAAARAGVTAGLPESTAQALCAELHCLPMAAEQERQLLQQLALLAYDITPAISLGDDALYLEVSGSLRLFQGQRALYQSWAHLLEQRQLEYRSALAHNPSAALLLSHGDSPAQTIQQALGWPLEQVQEKSLEQLGRLRVAQLPFEARVLEALEAMGIEQLERLLKLPERELGRRFGADFARQHRYLLGREEELRPRYHPPDSFESARHFNGGVDNREQLYLPMAQLLEELQRFLRLKQLLARELRWQWVYCDGEQDEVRMPLSSGVFQLDAVMALCRLHLEQQSLTGPVDSLFLSCQQFESLQTGSETLPGFEGSETENRRIRDNYATVLDTLHARLQEDECQQLQLADEYLPDLARPGSTTNRRTTDSARKLRPLWLLTQPKALLERDKILYYNGALELLQGPERFDVQWWRQRHSRDYYIARHPRGSLYWVYRDCREQRWYLHGLFS